MDRHLVGGRKLNNLLTRVQNAMLSANIEIHEFEEMCGLYNNCLYKYLRGQHRGMRPSTVAKIANGLGIGTSELTSPLKGGSNIHIKASEGKRDISKEKRSILKDLEVLSKQIREKGEELAVLLNERKILLQRYEQLKDPFGEFRIFFGKSIEEKNEQLEVTNE